MKKLFIDADSLIYQVVYSRATPIDGDFVGTNCIYKDFDKRVLEIVKECKKHFTFKDYVLVFSDVKSFRNDLYDDYKKTRRNRIKRLEEIQLKEYAYKKGIRVKNLEADDVVAYFARHHHPVASIDKDVLKGLAGKHFDYYHWKIVETSKEEAEKFLLTQCLAGDAGDDIKGISGVGYKNKLKYETFNDVIDIYIEKGYTKEDAILTRRLVDINQWFGFILGLKHFEK